MSDPARTGVDDARLDEALRAIVDPGDRVDLSARVWAAIETPRTGHYGGWSLGWVAAAAVALVATILVWQIVAPGGGTREAVSNVASGPSAPPDDLAAPVPGPAAMRPGAQELPQQLAPRSITRRAARTPGDPRTSVHEADELPISRLPLLEAPPPLQVARIEDTAIASDAIAIAPLSVAPIEVDSLDR